MRLGELRTITKNMDNKLIIKAATYDEEVGVQIFDVDFDMSNDNEIYLRIHKETETKRDPWSSEIKNGYIYLYYNGQLVTESVVKLLNKYENDLIDAKFDKQKYYREKRMLEEMLKDTEI